MKKLPVHVLTGFLGAGKTTLLNKALRKKELSNTAVIVNEFGDVALDHLLIETGGEEIIELANGCLCCTVRGDLAEALLRLAAQAGAEDNQPIDRIVIETSGLADPLPVLQTVGTLPPQGRALVPGNVIALVNAANGMSPIEAHEEALSQIRLADVIVLTNTDLPEGAENAGAVREKIKNINGFAEVFCSVADGFDAGMLFERLPGNPVRETSHHGHGHEHSHSRQNMAISILRDQMLSEKTIEMFCDLLLSSMAGNILRLKGIVETPEQPGHPLVVQTAGSVVYPFERLESWPEGPRGTKIVIIGNDLDAGYINRMFDAFAGNPSIDTPDRDALTDNPLAIPGYKP